MKREELLESLLDALEMQAVCARSISRYDYFLVEQAHNVRLEIRNKIKELLNNKPKKRRKK